MLLVCVLRDGLLQQQEIDLNVPWEQSEPPLWVDMVAPDAEEREWVQRSFGLAITREVTEESLEESARFFEEDDGSLHIRSDFLTAEEGAPDSVRVGFILSGTTLLSVRQVDLLALRLLRLRARRMPGLITDARGLLLAIYATDTEYSADVLEELYDKLEVVDTSLLTQSMSDANAEQALRAISLAENLSGRVRRYMLDTRRAVSFLMRSRRFNAEQAEQARELLRDIGSLDSHTDFLLDKCKLMMDATIGFVNVNQNKVVKIFSVASVAMLPPTLIASIYGMNFTAMPELRWSLGYPFALALMAASVIAPFWWFRRKGWLR